MEPSWAKEQPQTFARSLSPGLEDEGDLGPPPLAADVPLAEGISTAHDEALASLLQKPKTTQKPNPTHDSHLGNLHNPYDGAVIGTLDISAHPEAHFMSEAQSENEELWTRLTQVLDLQAQIAKLHVNMEGVGNTQAASDYSSPKPNIRVPTRNWGSTGRLSEMMVEDEGVDVKAETAAEEMKSRQREEEFARLAQQFEARKAGTDDIMDKVRCYMPISSNVHILNCAPSLTSYRKH